MSLGKICVARSVEQPWEARETQDEDEEENDPSEQCHPKGLHCCESDGLHRRPFWLVDIGALTLMRICEIHRSPFPVA